MQEACAGITSIPTIKAVQAVLTGEPIWRNVRPPLAAADAAEAERVAGVLDRLESAAMAGVREARQPVRVQ